MSIEPQKLGGYINVVKTLQIRFMDGSCATVKYPINITKKEIQLIIEQLKKIK